MKIKEENRGKYGFGLCMDGPYRIYKSFVKFKYPLREEMSRYNPDVIESHVIVEEYIYNLKTDVQKYVDCNFFDEREHKHLFSLVTFSENDHHETPSNGIIIVLSEAKFYENLAKFKKKVALEEEKRERIRTEKVRKRKEAREQRIATALAEAKKTNTDVFIETVDGYDGDVERPGEELGWVNINLYATPDGKVVKKESPCY